MNEAFSYCTCAGHQLNCCNFGSENQEVIARRAGNLSGLSRLPDGYMPYVLRDRRKLVGRSLFDHHQYLDRADDHKLLIITSSSVNMCHTSLHNRCNREGGAIKRWKEKEGMDLFFSPTLSCSLSPSPITPATQANASRNFYLRYSAKI